jgi:MoaA/NifB/PqqE/SkfB family radical SAM enzyme
LSQATTISWNIIRSCNYRCSYCTQYNDKLKGKKVENFEPFIFALEKLTLPLEVKFSGGEPFIFPGFLTLVQELCVRGITISVVTNFSAREHDLAKFIQITSGRLNVFSASLHLEFVVEKEFLQKCLWFLNLAREKQLDGNNFSFVVTLVASPGNLNRLIYFKELFQKYNINFKIQPLKHDGSIITYTEKEKEIIESLGGHNQTGVLMNNFRGARCLAGIKYFVFGPTGDVWRCYQAKKERKEFLGNILEGNFLPYTEARECPYDYCPCTVPIDRGMMSFV